MLKYFKKVELNSEKTKYLITTFCNKKNKAEKTAILSLN